VIIGGIRHDLFVRRGIQINFVNMDDVKTLLAQDFGNSKYARPAEVWARFCLALGSSSACDFQIFFLA
jgi:hypothetical protein